MVGESRTGFKQAGVDHSGVLGLLGSVGGGRMTLIVVAVTSLGGLSFWICPEFAAKLDANITVIMTPIFENIFVQSPILIRHFIPPDLSKSKLAQELAVPSG
jgi:hypothetical protein